MNLEESKEFLIKNEFVYDGYYLAKYFSIMESNLTTPKVMHETQKHHIVPKCVFNYMGKQVDNSESNLVNLKYTDHILAHYYLCMCAKEQRFLSANTLSIRYVLNGKKLCDFSLDEIDVEELNKKYSDAREYVYNVTHTQDACKKIQESLKGRPSPNKGNYFGVKNKIPKVYSELGKKRIGEGNSFYGKSHSDSTKEKISIANGHPVNMIDMESGEVIMSFVSVNSAVKYLMKIGATTNRSAFSRIDSVCRSEHKGRHAYGYGWEYKNKV